MKCNFFMAILGTFASALLAYWAYSIGENDTNSVALFIVGFLTMALTFVPTLGISVEDTRITTNIRALSVLFLFVFIVLTFCFASFGVKMPTYVILNGIIAIIYIAVLYKLIKL